VYTIIYPSLFPLMPHLPSRILSFKSSIIPIVPTYVTDWRHYCGPFGSKKIIEIHGDTREKLWGKMQVLRKTAQTGILPHHSVHSSVRVAAILL